MGTYVVALGYTTIGDATLFCEVHCLFLLMFDMMRCKRPSSAEAAGCIIAVSGGFILAQDHSGAAAHGSGPSLRGNVIALVGSLGAAVFIEYGGRATQRLGLLGYFSCMQTAAALSLLAVSLAEGPARPMLLQPLNPTNGLLGWLVVAPRSLGVVRSDSCELRT